MDLDRCVTAWPSKKKKNDGVAFYPYSVSTSFKLPLPSKTLLLLSNGALSNGRLKVTESSEITDVQVNVTVKYFSTAVRDSAKVCVIERYKGESGVGIFVRVFSMFICRITESLNADTIKLAQRFLIHRPHLLRDWTHFTPDGIGSIRPRPYHRRGQLFARR